MVATQASITDKGYTSDQYYFVSSYAYLSRLLYSTAVN